MVHISDQNTAKVHIGECVTVIELQRYPDLLGSQATLRAAIAKLWRGKATIGQLWRL